jgi:hypothetical protein
MYLFYFFELLILLINKNIKMNKLILITFTVIFIKNSILHAQNNEHKISYEISIKAENEKNENSIFINNLDFVKLEKFYLKNLDYSLKNIPKYDEIIKEYRFETLSFELLDDYPFIKKSGDTIFYKWYQNNYNTSLLNGKFYSLISQLSIDVETGFEMYDPNGNLIYEEIVILDDIHQVANKIHFNEKWSLNNEGKFLKKIDAFKFSGDDYSQELFLIAPEVLINNEKTSELVFMKNISYEVLFDKNPMEENSDFPYLNYLSFDGKKNLINPIISNVVQKKTEIYSPYKFDEEGNFKVIPHDKYMECLSQTFQIDLFEEWGEFMLDYNGEIKREDVTDFYHNKDIVGFHFVEDWYLDLKTNSFVKKVMYFGPIVKVIDKYSGEPMGNKLLFLIKN